MHQIALITTPHTNFNLFIQVCIDFLGFSPAETSDRTAREVTDTEKLLTCLAAMKDRDAAKVTPGVLSMVSMSAMLLADDYITAEFCEAACGMPFRSANTIQRNYKLTVLSGDLNQWRDLVVNANHNGEIRDLANNLMGQFEAFNLNLWFDYTKTYPRGTQTFLLEKR